MKKTFFLCLMILALSICAAPGIGAAIADSDCYECHKKLKSSFAEGTVHNPVNEGDCGSCHDDHGDQNKLMLTAEAPKLCLDCHDEMSGKYKHSPAEEGSCLDCHKVHNSPNRALLAKEVPELCGDCHDPFEGNGSVHQPVADGGCLDCHAAHDSAEAGLLVKGLPELCQECHDETDKSKGKSPHDPVAGGECGECHEAHQSKYKVLLKANYNLNRYVIYSESEYILCFNCHEKKPFEDAAAVDETEFRNGSTNLHFLHVVGKEEVNKYGIKKRREGMTCMGCHITHGTEQAKMIRYNLECGPTFCYTMNYRKFEGGGTCVVGCHKPKIYKISQETNTASQDAEEGNLTPVAQKNGSKVSAPSP